MADEVLQPARQMGRHDVEAVGRALCEPLLQLVRDLLGRTGEDPVAVPAAEPGDQPAEVEALPAGQLG